MEDKYSIFLNRFRSKSIKTSSTIFIWFISLILIWFLNLLPKNIEIQNNLIPSKHEYNEINKSNLILTTIKSQSQKLYELNKLSSEYVIFKLPGWDLPVKTVYAFPLWSIISLLFIIFIFESRKSLLGYISKGIRYFKTINPNEELTDVIGVHPFWIHPIPTKKGEIISKDVLVLALGIKENHKHSSIILYSLLIILISMQTHVMYMSVVANRVLENGTFILPFVNLLSIIITIIIFIRWHKFNIIPDYIPTEIVKNKISRRQAIYELSVLTASLLFLPLNNLFFRKSEFVLDQSNKNPRYRTSNTIPSINTGLKEGFYVNKKTNIIHEIDKDGFVKKANNLNTEMLVEVKKQIAILEEPGRIPIINPNIVKQSLEKNALLLIESKKIDLACQVLLNSIEYDLYYNISSAGEPNFRIYDLLAGLCLRYNRNEVFQELINKVTISTNKILLQRINVWNDISSNWRKKWDNKEFELKWAGVLM